MSFKEELQKLSNGTNRREKIFNKLDDLCKIEAKAGKEYCTISQWYSVDHFDVGLSDMKEYALQNDLVLYENRFVFAGSTWTLSWEKNPPEKCRVNMEHEININYEENVK